MYPGFARAAILLFLHLLILLGVENGGDASRVLNTEKLTKIGDPKDTEIIRLGTIDVLKENEGRSHVGAVDNQFWIYDKKDDAIDNQFWIYGKKNDAVDNQFWIYDKKNDAVDNHFWIYAKKNEAVDKQVWIYDGKNEAADKKNDAVDNQVWIYDGKNDAVDNQVDDKKNDAVDNQVWIYDRKNDAVDKQVWIYDGKNEAADKKNDAVDNQVWIYDGKNDAVENQVDDKKNDAVEKQVWIYDRKNNEEILHSSSHTDHMDPSLPTFFHLEDLKLGKTMFTNFPKRDPLSSLVLLPKEKADTIPFSLQEFPNLLQFFPFPHNSPQAKAMEDTLRKCEAKPIKGETKFCATSNESMLAFARSVFGLGTNVKVLSTVHLKDSTVRQQKYTITQVPERISAPKMVACHTMPYPYTVLYCHYQESESRVYKVSIDGEDGDRVEAIAVCHMDTSQWSRNHISFRVLGIEPGTNSPVCHFFAADHLVLVPS